MSDHFEEYSITGRDNECDLIVLDTVTPEEQSAIDLYRANTNCFAHNLNESLRTGEQQFEEYVSLLDAASRKFECPKGIQLFRATSTRDFLGMDMSVGQVYRNPQFMSCTKDLEVLPNFFTHDNPVFLRIKCPALTRMANMDTSANPSESEGERLLGRHHSFRISRRIEHSKSSVEGRRVMEAIMGRDRIDDKIISLLELHLEMECPT